MKRVFIAASLGLALASGSAFAADMALKSAPPPPLAPAPTWTGCYADAGWGYGLVNQNTRLLTFPDPVNGPGGVGVALDQGERGWTGRIGGGCDYQLGGNLSSWVVGAFGDFDFTGIKGFHTGEQFGTVGLVSGEQKLNNTWAVGGRIGYLITPNLLTYFDGGWTEAKFGSVSYFTGAGFADGLGIPSQTFHGWFLGGGEEYALNFSWLPIQGLFWRNEYRFSQFSNRNVPVNFTATGTQLSIGGVPTAEATKAYEQTITSSLVWRFNWTGH